MPGTLTPNQMYDNECNVLKGWPHMHAVDKSAPIAAGENIVAGSVCYLDSNAEFRSGLADNTQGHFAWPNSSDFDVDGDVGNVQKQILMGIPSITGYELWTTSYDSTDTYVPNDYLTAWDSQLGGYSADKKGLVRKGNPYEHTLIGQVSNGTSTNDYGKSILTLWCYHLPIDASAPSSPEA